MDLDILRYIFWPTIKKLRILLTSLCVYRRRNQKPEKDNSVGYCVHIVLRHVGVH